LQGGRGGPITASLLRSTAPSGRKLSKDQGKPWRKWKGKETSGSLIEEIDAPELVGRAKEGGNILKKKKKEDLETMQTKHDLLLGDQR